eukprot:tig00000792_g4164.t1
MAVKHGATLAKVGTGLTIAGGVELASSIAMNPNDSIGKHLPSDTAGEKAFKTVVGVGAGALSVKSNTAGNISTLMGARDGVSDAIAEAGQGNYGKAVMAAIPATAIAYGAPIGALESAGQVALQGGGTRALVGAAAKGAGKILGPVGHYQTVAAFASGNAATYQVAKEGGKMMYGAMERGYNSTTPEELRAMQMRDVTGQYQLDAAPYSADEAELQAYYEELQAAGYAFEEGPEGYGVGGDDFAPAEDGASAAFLYVYPGEGHGQLL